MEKYIKKFNTFLNEKVSQKDIDKILDKINTHGIDSLTDDERNILSNIDNPSFESKEDIINFIKDIVEKNDNYFSIWDLILDADTQDAITYKINDDIKDKIEIFTDFGVVIISYQDEEEVLGDYEKEYEDLDLSILKEIKNLFETAIKNGLL
jgi:hypothetical protein